MQMTQTVHRLSSLLGLTLAIVLSAQQGLAEAGQNAQTERVAEKGQAPAKKQKWEPTPERLEDLYHRVWQVIGDLYYSPEQLENWGEWEHKYKGKLTKKQELDKALEAMVSSLGDRWTTYTSKDERTGAAFQQYLEKSVPTGMHLARNADGTYRVESLLYGSPAQKSQIRVGDTITHIDMHALKGLTPARVSEMLRAPIETSLRVAFSNNGEEYNIELAMAITPPPPVVAKLLNRSILYARLPDFRTDEILATFERCILELYRKAPNGIDAIVLDLRGNPGGEFKRGVLVASYFLDHGVVATSTTRDGRLLVDAVHRTTPVLPHQKQGLTAEWLGLLAVLHEKPLVVLVDGSSMSASELVAGALKDNRRARIVGTPTFGKAVGYQIFELDNEGELAITGLRYATPNGMDVSKGGLQPDVSVPLHRGSQDTQLAAAVQELTKLIQQQQPGPAGSN